MNSLKYIISGIIGAGLGAFTTYILMKRQYDAKIQAELKEEMDKFKENYTDISSKAPSKDEKEEISEKTRKLIEKDDEDCEDPEEEDPGKVKRYREYRKIADDYHETYEIERDSSERPSNHQYTSTPPYIFDPNDGYIPENREDYDHEIIYYYPEDGTCISEMGGLMTEDEVNDALGRSNLIEFDKIIDDAREKGTITIENPPIIHIRNEKYEVEYEVTFNMDLY